MPGSSVPRRRVGGLLLSLCACLAGTDVHAQAAPSSEKATFAAEVLFDEGSADIKPGTSTATLDDLVKKAQSINLEVIIAVGHTDTFESTAAQKLSVRRTDAVKAYLVGRSLEANRIYTEGKAEKQPVADNKDPAGRAKNRRVELEILGTRARTPAP